MNSRTQDLTISLGTAAIANAPVVVDLELAGWSTTTDAGTTRTLDALHVRIRDAETGRTRESVDLPVDLIDQIAAALTTVPAQLVDHAATTTRRVSY